MFFDINPNVRIPRIFRSNDFIHMNPLYIASSSDIIGRGFYGDNRLINEDPYGLNNNFNVFNVDENINGFFDEF